MDIALALAAAFFFALGLVLQEKAASDQPPESVGAGFLTRLARQPVWLLGLLAQGIGFVAQAIALGIGRMVVVGWDRSHSVEATELILTQWKEQQGFEFVTIPEMIDATGFQVP